MQVFTEPLAIGELLVRYLRWAEQYYRRRITREPTGEHANIHASIKPFVLHVGDRFPAHQINRHMVRAWMDGLIVAGLSRGYINQCLARLRRMCKWAAELDLIPIAVYDELRMTRPLPAFRCDAYEPAKVQAAVLQQVWLSVPYLPPIPRDVVQLLMLTGARRAEILERVSAEVIPPTPEKPPFAAALGRLEPRQHKTAHRGKSRIIQLCPEAWTIVERLWRPLTPAAPLFPAPRSRTSAFYSQDALQAAITRACKKAGVPRYTPHMIRHAVARIIREGAGLEHARAQLGHSSVQMTEHYAPLEATKAVAAAAAIQAHHNAHQGTCQGPQPTQRPSVTDHTTRRQDAAGVAGSRAFITSEVHG